MAIEGPVCDETEKVDLSNLSKILEDKVDSMELTADDLNAMEEELSKIVTTEQKDHAMSILRTMGEGASESAKVAAAVSSKVHTF